MNTEKQKTTKFEFDSECTIYQATQLHVKLLSSFSNTSEVVLDVSEIETVDASFLQLLVAAQIEASNNNVKINISGSSEALNVLVAKTYCQIILDSDAIQSTLEVTPK